MSIPLKINDLALFFCAILLLIISLIALLLRIEDVVYLNVLVSVAIFTLFMAFLSYFLSNRIHTFSILLILSVCIVHFQVPFVEILGYEMQPHRYNLYWGGDSKYKPLAISGVGFSALVLGLLFGSLRSVKFTEYKYEETYHDDQRYRKALYSLSLISFLLLFLVLFFDRNFLFGTYTAAHRHPLASYIFKVYTIVTLSCIFLNLYRISRLTYYNNIIIYIKSFGSVLNCSVFIYIILALNSGERGTVLMFFLAYFSVYLLVNHKLIRFAFPILLVCGAMLLTFVGEARVKIKGEVIESSVDYTPWYDERLPLILHATSELSLSGMVANYVANNVPENVEHTYGLYFLHDLVRLVPGLSGVFNTLFIGDEIAKRSSSYLATTLIQGDSFTYGNGTTVIAEAYAEFNVFGVLFALFIYGLFFSVYENKFHVRGVDKISFWNIFALIAMSRAIYVARSGVTQELSNAFLIFSLTVVALYLVSKLKSNR